MNQLQDMGLLTLLGFFFLFYQKPDAAFVCALLLCMILCCAGIFTSYPKTCFILCAGFFILGFFFHLSAFFIQLLSIFFLQITNICLHYQEYFFICFLFTETELILFCLLSGEYWLFLLPSVWHTAQKNS